MKVQHGNETLVFDGYIWQRMGTEHTCEHCQHWQIGSDVKGWATCDLLVHQRNGWKLVPRVEAEAGSASIVKTYRTFGCRYFEERE